jgi:chaperonin cofactor prefoldin
MWQKLDTQSVYRDVGDFLKNKKKKKMKKSVKV